MSLQSLSHNGSTEIKEGIYLFRANAAYDQLEVSDFERVQVFLPPLLERAVHKRKIEFLLGRYCLQQCFKAFAVPPIEVPIGEDRSPVWPKGWLGSISHTRGQAVAILARATRYAGLGIDVEATIDRPGSGLQAQICCDSREIEDVQSGLNLSDTEALTLVFSAKESLYKLIYPRYRVYFGFQAARIRYSPVHGLEIVLTKQLSDEFPEGRAWPVQWQRLDAQTLETLLTESAQR